jgi:hypothetical protein
VIESEITTHWSIKTSAEPRTNQTKPAATNNSAPHPANKRAHNKKESTIKWSKEEQMNDQLKVKKKQKLTFSSHHSNNSEQRQRWRTANPPDPAGRS